MCKVRAWLLVVLACTLFAACGVAMAQPAGNGWELCATLGGTCERGEGFWQAMLYTNTIDWGACALNPPEWQDYGVNPGPISFGATPSETWCGSPEPVIANVFDIYVRKLEEPGSEAQPYLDLVQVFYLFLAACAVVSAFKLAWERTIYRPQD